MDFKIAGTKNGITGIQLDLKIAGISGDIIRATLAQSREARIEILRNMLSTISRPRQEISQYAPRLLRTMIDPEKIGLLIGPGGKTIRGIQEATGATINVEEDGTVFIACSNAEKALQAKAAVEALGAEIKVGAVYSGKVVAIKEFGCFVELAPGTDGMCHVSELSHGYVKKVDEVVKVGDALTVKVINIDDNGRIKLSRKAMLPAPEGAKA
ncbi:MAG: S1 RNA-binding domain-containing protein [bacterium]